MDLARKCLIYVERVQTCAGLATLRKCGKALLNIVLVFRRGFHAGETFSDGHYH